jgi:signal transduction histidine kinase
MDLPGAALAALSSFPGSVLMLFDADGRQLGAFGGATPALAAQLGALSSPSPDRLSPAVRRAVAMAREQEAPGASSHVVSSDQLRAVAWRIPGTPLVACHVQLLDLEGAARDGSRLEAVARHFAHLVCEVDEHGTVTYAGGGAGQLGSVGEDVLHGPVSSLMARLLDPESASSALRSLEKFVASQRALEPIAIEGRDPTGRPRRLVVSGRWYHAGGGEPRGILLFRDAPHSDSAASERAAALNDLAGSLVDAVLELTRAGEILSAAPLPAAWAAAGESLEGRSVFEFLHPEDVERARIDLSNTDPGSRLAPAIFRWRAATGGWRSVETRSVVYAHAEAERIIVVGRDVSDEIAAIAAAEAAPLDAVAETPLGDRNLIVLASGVAHDFNNLLTVALGVTDLIAEQLEPESPVRAQLAQVVVASREAAALARQLLAVTGHGRTSPAPCDVSSVIESIEGLLRSALPRSVTLELHVGSRLWIEGDPTQIRQVLLNLVTNAGEAIGPRMGHVTVEAQGGVGEYGQRVVVIEVRDDGPGMGEQARQRIFDPTFTTKRTGHGLGLAVVKSVVTRHRGSIRVDSTPSQGTTFRIELPQLLEPQTLPEVRMRETLRQPAGVDGGTVLVVDDNQAVRKLSSALLGLASFSALEAGDAETARRLVADTPGLACAVVDLVMPDADGLALVEELRALQPGLKIVVCSGAHDRLPTERADLVVLEKPFRYAQLLDAVLRCIRADGAQAAAAEREAFTASST